MPISLQIEHPGDNDVVVAASFLEKGSGAIVVRGKNNVVRIEDAHHAGAANFVLAGGARLTIESRVVFFHLGIHLLAEGATTTIGAGSGFNGSSVITVHERANVAFGAGCLIASDVVIAASDVHKIFDVETGERLNEAGDITLGERVWVSHRATLLKNTSLGDDSVVGASSVVSSAFPPNSLVAGVPARLIRSGIRWER